MDIGHRMKELRVHYGLTQQELADRSELSKGFISQLERNLTSPSVGTLLDIIQCLGTTPAEFFADDEPAQLVFKNEDYFEKEDEVDFSALLSDMKKTDDELEQVQGEFVSLLKELTSTDETTMSLLNDLIEKMGV